MISTLQLRQIIERGFLPLSCTCTVNPDGSLMIKVFEPESGCVELLVTGVLTADLVSSREIASLIGELRGEMGGRKTLSLDAGSSNPPSMQGRVVLTFHTQKKLCVSGVGGAYDLCREHRPNRFNRLGEAFEAVHAGLI
ncbi:DUF1652 domain-containing protein [Pseudomonas frederiksbergensis]|uniref:DUF1652 domain-containing protein n=1 Tax=Pseudomonas frederiksbergensis TaxID=104087 RepID=UPI003D21E586